MTFPWPVIFLFLGIIVSLLTAIVLFSAAKALHGWKRAGAIILGVLSLVSLFFQGMLLLIVLSFGGYS